MVMSFFHPFRLIFPAWFLSAVQVLPVCNPPSCGTLLVCYWHLEHTTDSLHPLPIHADTACGIPATWVIRAHTSHLVAMSGTQHSTDCITN
jgi:hypothetical protein